MLSFSIFPAPIITGVSWRNAGMGKVPAEIILAI
jgi:hypothetical protein